MADKSAPTPPEGKGGRPPKIIPAIDASFEDVIKALVKAVKPRPRKAPGG